jgi:hypothetical protein
VLLLAPFRSYHSWPCWMRSVLLFVFLPCCTNVCSVKEDLQTWPRAEPARLYEISDPQRNTLSSAFCRFANLWQYGDNAWSIAPCSLQVYGIPGYPLHRHRSGDIIGSGCQDSRRRISLSMAGYFTGRRMRSWRYGTTGVFLDVVVTPQAP